MEAGGEIAKKNVKQNIIRYGYYRTDTTGQLYRSIKTIKSTDKDGRKYVDVTAAGKREDGTRNGEVAFVLNYGRSNLDGTRYWQEAEERTKKEYDKVLQEKTEAQGIIDEIIGLLRSKHITYACAYNILNGVMDALTEFSRQLPM